MAAYRRVRVTIGLAIAAFGALALSAPAAASTPTLMWTDVKRVNLLCNVAGAPGVDYLALTKQLCADVQRLASKGAPVPVSVIPLGDPSVLASATVTILVHGSVTTHGQDRLLAFAMRPFRTSSDQSSVLFGAAPRVAPLPASGGASPSLEAALNAALAEILPWRGRPAVQPIVNN